MSKTETFKHLSGQNAEARRAPLLEQMLTLGDSLWITQNALAQTPTQISTVLAQQRDQNNKTLRQELTKLHKAQTTIQEQIAALQKDTRDDLMNRKSWEAQMRINLSALMWILAPTLVVLCLGMIRLIGWL